MARTHLAQSERHGQHMCGREGRVGRRSVAPDLEVDHGPQATQAVAECSGRCLGGSAVSTTTHGDSFRGTRRTRIPRCLAAIVAAASTAHSSLSCRLVRTTRRKRRPRPHYHHVRYDAAAHSARPPAEHPHHERGQLSRQRRGAIRTGTGTTCPPA